MRARFLTYVMMPIAIVMAFVYAPPAAVLGDASRILYFHVPLAWISVLAFIVSGIESVRFLAAGNLISGERAADSADIGMLFTILATVTGSIWAKVSWGSYWNWDPRETSIVILFMIYAAYFTLRWRLTGNDSRNRISAIYLVMAAVTVPFFVFIVPRMYPSLHPDPIINAQKKIHMDARMLLTLCVSILSYSTLYFYLMNILFRLSRVKSVLRTREDI